MSMCGLLTGRFWYVIIQHCEHCIGMRKGAVMMLEEPGNTSRVVGIKQVRRALGAGRVKRLYLARDADPLLTQPLADQAWEQGVDAFWFSSMKELGQDCGIAVGAAVAAEI